jgi:hypothetical protein
MYLCVHIGMDLGVVLRRQSTICGLSSALGLFHFFLCLITRPCIILLLRENAIVMFYSGICGMYELLFIFLLYFILIYNVIYSY